MTDELKRKLQEETALAINSPEVRPNNGVCRVCLSARSWHMHCGFCTSMEPLVEVATLWDDPCKSCDKDSRVKLELLQCVSCKRMTRSRYD
jgi:hypothetical protein